MSNTLGAFQPSLELVPGPVSGVHQIARPRPVRTFTGWRSESIVQQIKLWCDRYPLLESPKAAIDLPLDPQDGFEGYLVFPFPSALQPASAAFMLALERSIKVVLLNLQSEQGFIADVDTADTRRKDGNLERVRERALRYPHHAFDGHTMQAYMRAKLYGDFLIARAQTGARYAGMTQPGLYASDDEVGMDAFAAACLLWSHPTHLRSAAHAWMDCPGSTLYPRTAREEQDNTGPSVIHVSHVDGQRRMSWEHTRSASEFAGVATMRFV